MTPADSPASRAVVVLGDRQGSGVALNGRLVLTCAHVVGASSAPQVAHPRRTHRTTAQVIWSDEEQDAALLLTAEELPCAAHVRVGHLATERALPECEIIGYPHVQRHAGRHLATDQFTGRVLPAAARPRSVLTFSFDRAPAVERPDAPSPLAGLSGAPVFSGDVLLGIVTSVPRDRGHLRAEGVPVSDLTSLPYDFPETEPITRHHLLDREYERDYARSVGSAFRRMKIFGLDDLNRRESEWDLDTAYLSLEASPRISESAARNLDTSTTRQPFSLTARAPQRVDALLSTRPRVLLRGEAGAGKTTLVWWLAAHTAAGTLGPTLAGLNSLVPFIIPLRTLRSQNGAFPSPAGLPHAARLVVDEAPDGWASRVMEAGRALLLVDGLDEIPQSDREEAHRWLSALLARYPHSRCLATVRPLAVEPDWLEAERFEELRLLPMRDDDIQRFITAWHRAARLEDDDHALLAELEQDLSQQFRHNPALSDLARTPLLCAVICALHRRHQGFLPETRFKLYQSALEMLLGHRDTRRRVHSPDGITMTVEEHHQILQRIAVWLVRCGQTEFTRDQARPQLRTALAGMERVRRQDSPEAILTHLLNRSGLLQERGDGSYQFIHRTFQDFLAAKELVESDSLRELVRNADDVLWQDVVLLAAGHCRREIGELLTGLLTRADAPDTPAPPRVQLYVLTALCAQHAAWLDSGLQQVVRDRITALVASLTSAEVPQVARLGPHVLQFLPDPETLDPIRGRAVAELVGRVGGSEAIPYARRLVTTPGLPSAVSARLAHAWSNFPAAEYAHEVLGEMPPDPALPLPVTTREQLGLLHRLAVGRHLALSGPLTSAELAAAELPQLQTLRLDRLPHLEDLDFLHVHGQRLQHLSVTTSASALKDISAVTALPVLAVLSLRVQLQNDALGHLAEIPALTALTLSTPYITSVGSIPVHRGVTRLSLPVQRLVDTQGLDAWESLTSLMLPSPLNTRGFWGFIRDSGRVSEVDTTVQSFSESFSELRHLGVLPGVKSLRLRQVTDLRGVEQLAEVFPSLTRLALTAPTGHRLTAEDPSLTRLTKARPDLEISLTHPAPVAHG
ncbi:NACHT domain-containing protein [Streptomyces sp. DSM 40750]|uniref:NACHT domain-containing protein n=1 Tax=Streptomyces sp. DSM 40750 TaxID=2801030 RepID=UPI00214B735D|nr:NACHT domain-containing protein [Streptomyces sp. DSM 40750]UUU22691.1 NACHT domain-containing protein [Streptomyces sp. DSM 40750]